MTDILEALFGSKSRTRMLRFFLLNSDQEYTMTEITEKNMLKNGEVRKEIASFKKIKFVQERAKNRKKHYILNKNFPYYLELRGLIARSNTFPQCKSLKKIKGIGNVKLALVSGIFLNYPKSKVDLLLVVDSVSRGKLKNLMNNLEAEVGKEIRYVLITNDELLYRLNMLDRFLLDFFENPHEEIVNKVPKLKRTLANLGRKTT